MMEHLRSAAVGAKEGPVSSARPMHPRVLVGKAFAIDTQTTQEWDLAKCNLK